MVTESGIVIAEVKLAESLKASAPIVVSLVHCERFSTANDEDEQQKNIPSGIVPVKIDESTRLYDLQGRPVEKVTPGIYITSEGQKVWIK